MNDNQFSIFKPTNKFTLSIDRIVYTLILLSVLIQYLSNKYNGKCIFGYFPVILFLISIISLIIVAITSCFIRERLLGVLGGILQLNEESIIVDKNEILIDDIESIEFKHGDYIDKKSDCLRNGIKPKRSNGVKNFCIIRTTSGNNILVQFQQLNEADFLKNRDFIILYYIKGKMKFNKLVKILKIESYEDIQNFKNEITIKNII